MVVWALLPLAGFAAPPAEPLLTEQWSFEADWPQSYLGNTVAGAGDVNGDGFADLLVAAGRIAGPNGLLDGATLWFPGSPTGPLPVPGWYGDGGGIPAGIGDLDGDGFDDAVVGSPYADAGPLLEAGNVSLFRGTAGGPEPAASWRIEGTASVHHVGWAVAGAGDVDGDGLPDFAIGRPGFQGKALVLLGDPAGVPVQAASQPDTPGGGEFGAALAGAGDVDQDGHADLLVGAPSLSDPEFAEGAAFLFAGATDGVDPVALWTFEQDLTQALVGDRLDGAGDVNGDGFDDILIGTPNFTVTEPAEGTAWLFLGGPEGPSAAPDWQASGGEQFAKFAFGLSGAGDLDADGFADVAIGAPDADRPIQEGRAGVYRGDGVGVASTPAWTADGGANPAEFGYSVDAAGDTNGDGFADLVIGDRGTNGSEGEGRAILYLGGCGPAVDADADGVVDGCDACPGFDDRADGDGDGLPDGCEPPEDTDEPVTPVDSGGPGAEGDTGTPAAPHVVPRDPGRHGCGCDAADAGRAGPWLALTGAAVCLRRRRQRR
jgi:hypothetical protein